MPKNSGLNVNLQEICAYPVSRNQVIPYLAKRLLDLIKDLKSIPNIFEGVFFSVRQRKTGKRNINRYIGRVKTKEDFQMLRPQAKECQCWEHPESSLPFDTPKLL